MSKDRAKFKTAAMFLTLGVEVSGAIVATSLVGYWIDNWLDTSPFGICIFVLLGTSAAFWRVWKIAKWYEKQDP